MPRLRFHDGVAVPKLTSTWCVVAVQEKSNGRTAGRRIVFILFRSLCTKRHFARTPIVVPPTRTILIQRKRLAEISDTVLPRRNGHRASHEPPKTAMVTCAGMIAHGTAASSPWRAHSGTRPARPCAAFRAQKMACALHTITATLIAANAAMHRKPTTLLRLRLTDRCFAACSLA